MSWLRLEDGITVFFYFQEIMPVELIQGLIEMHLLS